MAFAVLSDPTSVTASEQPRLPRLGLLSPASPAITWFADSIRQGLKELGYIEGKNVELELRWAEGRFDRLSELAAELVERNVDVIIAAVTQASIAAKQATASTPLIMVAAGDPVGARHVPSLARPGGDVTGASTMAVATEGKQSELFKELDPTMSRVAVLWNPLNTVFRAMQLSETKAAGRQSGLELQFVAASKPEELHDGFTAIRQIGAQGLHILGDPVFTRNYAMLSTLARQERLITVSATREFPEASGLLSYGANYYFEAAKRSAAYIDKIVKGAKPADLPATMFELVVNLETANALKIVIPLSIMSRADKVIE